MVIERLKKLIFKLNYHLFFTRRPRPGEYCNSKKVGEIQGRAATPARKFLVFIRAGGSHQVGGLTPDRNFDLALNLYAPPPTRPDCEFLVSGGLSKFCAAAQVLSSPGFPTYEGYLFLDDDLEVSCSEVCRFLDYCHDNRIRYAQPSLTRDSFYSFEYLLNRGPTGRRNVELVEVMMPYLSRSALEEVAHTFEESISTWGLDCVWPALLDDDPVVIDDFQVRHTKVVGGGAFYTYLRKIGVNPKEECDRLIAKYSR